MSASAKFVDLALSHAENVSHTQKKRAIFSVIERLAVMEHDDPSYANLRNRCIYLVDNNRDNLGNDYNFYRSLVR